MTQTYEELYQGFDIYVEPNPDPYRGGLVWSVCRDSEELASDLVFCMDAAILEAKGFVLEKLQES